MRYVMKQKLFSWGDDFAIKDADGQDIFFVDGKAFSFGDQLAFKDMAGNELAYIKQKVFSWSRTYHVYRGGQLAATIKKQLFTFFKCRFAIDVPGSSDLETTGDFLDHEYTFTRGGSTVASVSKKWFSWTDTYGVDVADNEDDILILAATVAIDMACHSKKNN